MPTYTIFEDPPWMNSRASAAPTASSVYSEDVGDTSMPVAEAPSPLRSHKKNDNVNGALDRFHAHPQQQVTDRGPQQRTSKHPLFQQVRSILHKPSTLVTPSNSTKWDELSGEPSSSGKAAQVKPSNYVNPYEGAFKARQHSMERAKKPQRDVSPVSVLQDEDEIKPILPLKAGRNTPSLHSPVSPISSVTTDPTDSSAPNTYLKPSQGKTAKLPKNIRRKPVSSSSPSASENMPPQRKTSLLNVGGSPGANAAQEEEAMPPKSRFSWSTLATSVAPGRQSTDTAGARITQLQQEPMQLSSRFSWSTVNTAAPNQPRTDPNLPEPPPPIPQQYTHSNQYTKNPPMQSILSRSRPIQRQEEQWTPPRKTVSPASRTNTPTSSTSRGKAYPASLTANTTTSTTSPTNNSKRLPPPPPSSTPQSHLEELLTQEADVQQQRRNLTKAITDLEKIEKASPLEVPFAQVRDARRELERLRRRMDEVGVEEAEVGRAIVRARRKEEALEGFQGSGLWVRRVTG